MSEAAGGRRYWAFISYSHADSALARWLHGALETYEIPHRLVGRPTPDGPAPRRLRPVFKDREDMPAAPDLRTRVQRALASSACLIVVCTPSAVRSAWVEEEITRFKALHGESRVFALVAAGTPHASRSATRADEECFPPALRFHVDGAGVLTAEPADIAAADLRPGGDGRRVALLKLVAGILGVELDELIRRDAQRRTRRLTALSAASLALAGTMGALALAALAARDEARVRKGHADGFIEFMIGDLNERLRPLGRLDILDSVAGKAMSYYRDQTETTLDDRELGQRARVLHLLGDISQARGQMDRAAGYFDAAAKSTAELLARSPLAPGRILDHAESLFREGYLAQEGGRLDEAEARFGDYRRLTGALSARDPNNEAWASEAADAELDMGTLELARGEAGAARAAFDRSLATYRRLSEHRPADRQRRMQLIDTLAWRADSETAARDFPAALRDRLAEKAQCAALVSSRADDREATDRLVVADMAIGHILLGQGRPHDAEPPLEASARLAEDLIAIDASNGGYAEHAAGALSLLSKARLEQGDPAGAKAAADRARPIAETLARRSPNVEVWSGALLGEARLAEIAAAAALARTPAERRAALAPAAEEERRLAALSRVSPRDRRLAEAAAEAVSLGIAHDVKATRTSQNRGKP